MKMMLKKAEYRLLRKVRQHTNARKTRQLPKVASGVAKLSEATLDENARG